MEQERKQESAKPSDMEIRMEKLEKAQREENRHAAWLAFRGLLATGLNPTKNPKTELTNLIDSGVTRLLHLAWCLGLDGVSTAMLAAEDFEQEVRDAGEDPNEDPNEREDSHDDDDDSDANRDVPDVPESDGPPEHKRTIERP